MQSANTQGSNIQQQSSTTEKVLEPSDSLSYGIYLFDKKVRNLEKKKAKIEKYVKDKKQGKELNDDQLQAINRFDDTIAALAVTRDMKKQFEDTVEEVNKYQKKQSKKAMYTEKESRRSYLKDVLCMKAILMSISQHPELQKMLIAQNDIFRSDDQKSKAVLQEINDITKSFQRSSQCWISDNDEDVNRLFNLIEGKMKPISTSSDVTYSLAKNAILSIKDTIIEYLKENNLKDTQCSSVSSPSPMQPVDMQNDDPFKSTITNDVKNDVNTVNENMDQLSIESSRDKAAQQIDSEKKNTKTNATIKSITFTNRNFTNYQQINPTFSYDQMLYDRMDPADSEIIDRESIHSPVAFVSSGGYESRHASGHFPSQRSHAITANDDGGFFVPMQPQYNQHQLQQQNSRYPPGGVYPAEHAQIISQIQRMPYNAAHSQHSSQSTMRYPQTMTSNQRPQFEQKGYRRAGDRAQRPTGTTYQRPTFANRSAAIRNDDQSRRPQQQQFTQRSAVQPRSQNY